MNQAPQIVSKILKRLSESCYEGVNLLQLEGMAEEMLKDLGAKSYNKGYTKYEGQKPYPAILCLNVNDEIAHTPPRDYKLKAGDLLTIDIGIKYKGYAGDAALTVGIGELSNRDRRLLKAAKKALYIGIGEVKAGVKISRIGIAIEQFCRIYGYSVNYSTGGHDIDKKMHNGMIIPMFDVSKRITDPEKEPVLQEGQVICIEPVLSFEDNRGFLQEDGWTIKTRDGRKAAMFEHMIEVTKEGFKVLTDHIELTAEDLKP